MTKNVNIRPNAILLNKYFKQYGYWSNFCFDYFPETFASPATIDLLNSNGFQINSANFNKVKELLMKFNISNTEITDNLSIVVLIIKSTVKDLAEYSLANQLQDTKQHVTELGQIKDLISKHEQFTTIRKDLKQKGIKQYDSQVEIKINLTHNSTPYNYKFTDGNIRMVLLRALTQHFNENSRFYNAYTNDNSYPTIEDLTKQNKVNTPSKNNVLLTHKRRIAKATIDFFSEFNFNFSQNKKFTLIGKLFELGGLIESEIDFNKNIAPSTSYKAVGLKSIITPYEKYLQQNIKKFIQEFEQT